MTLSDKKTPLLVLYYYQPSWTIPFHFVMRSSFLVEIKFYKDVM